MNDKVDRAIQFAPFAALTGYYDIISEREKIYSERRERSDEENAELSEKMNMLKKGMTVKITYYCEGGYEIREGIVSAVDIVFRSITVVRTKIFFDDIYAMEIIDLNE